MVKKIDALNVLMCFEMELGREALTAVRADNRAGANERISRVQRRRCGERRTEFSSEPS